MVLEDLILEAFRRFADVARRVASPGPDREDITPPAGLVFFIRLPELSYVVVGDC